MSSLRPALESYLRRSPRAVLVEVTEVKGSAPRERGAWMLVSTSETFGTIGGGQLEYMAIDEARQRLARGFSTFEWEMTAQQTERVGRGSAEGDRASSTADATLLGSFAATRSSTGSDTRLCIPLGPEIGQCCGGRVELELTPIYGARTESLLRSVAVEEAARPHVYLFGGGHVGHALGAAMALLPVHLVVAETREDALAGMPASAEKRLVPMPEQLVREAPAGSAFVVLTHDHALDFLIVAEALKRQDAAYVGMIGSKTKRATFRSWYLKSAGGTETDFARLVSPIGGDRVSDKRPEVIAALAAAEIIAVLDGYFR